MGGRTRLEPTFTVDMITAKPTKDIEEATLGALFTQTGLLLAQKLSEVDPTYFSDENRAILEKVCGLYEENMVEIEPGDFLKAGKMNGSEVAKVMSLQMNRNSMSYDDYYRHLQEVVSENWMKERALNILKDPTKATDEIEAMQRIAEGKTTFRKFEHDRDTIRNAPPSEPLFMFGQDIGFCFKRHITVFKAQSKSGKTTAQQFFLSLLTGASSTIANAVTSGTAGIFDTEQDHADVGRIFDAVESLGGNPDFIRAYTLDDVENSNDRLQMIAEAIACRKPTLAIIDNVKDLCEDYMDAAKSERTVRRLMSIAKRNDCAIIAIIHENPGSDKARGHLGSLLYEKAHDVVSLTREEGSSTVCVSSYKSRKRPFPRFSFTWNDKGFFQLSEGDFMARPTNQKTAHLENLFKQIFASNQSGALRAAEIARIIPTIQSMSTRNAERLVKEAKDSRIIYQKDEGKGYYLSEYLRPQERTLYDEEDLPE